ncbi:MAG: 30S ribosomal protein S6, partial [Chloroflexi bacterium]|nr:30S ribosomal protein S6 [Chloroflexota bacterium]
MQSYEIITIVDPQVSDDGVLEATEKLNRLILNKGGTLGRVQRWGRRRLAYPINRHTEGHYVLTHFVLDPQLTSELSTELQVSEEVLKHMIVKIEAEDCRIYEEPAEPKPKDE